MAITLAEMSRLLTDPLKKGVVDVFRRESKIMDRLSFEDSGTLSIEVLRTKTLPTVGWRKIGNAYGSSQGVTEPIVERVHSLGGSVDVDKAYVRATNTVVKARSVQTDMFTTAIALGFNDAFINGDPTANADTLVGLFYRFISGAVPSGQSLNLNGLDISPDVGTTLSANFDTFLDNFQALIHNCDGHKADAVLMNQTLYLRIVSALRQKGLFSQSQDNYGRTIVTYGPGGPELIDIGNKADQTSLVIGNVETNAGTALTGGGATSAYAVRWNTPYVAGFQEYPLEVQDLGLINDGVTYRTVIDWTPGIFMINPRAVARLSGVIAA